MTGGSGRLDVTSGAGGLSYVGGTATAGISVSSAGGSITFGAAATTVVEAGFGAGVVYNLIGGSGGGANVITGFRAGIDKLSMQGNLAITSAVSGRGITTFRFNDGTSLQLNGVANSRGLFG